MMGSSRNTKEEQELDAHGRHTPQERFTPQRWRAEHGNRRASHPGLPMLPTPGRRHALAAP